MLARSIKRKTKDETTDALLCILLPLPEWMHTVTYDNGLLRQYFPKAMPLHEVTPEQVQDVADRLNDRQRKCLGYQTPREAFWDAMI